MSLHFFVNLAKEEDFEVMGLLEQSMLFCVLSYYSTKPTITLYILIHVVVVIQDFLLPAETCINVSIRHLAAWVIRWVLVVLLLKQGTYKGTVVAFVNENAKPTGHITKIFHFARNYIEPKKSFLYKLLQMWHLITLRNLTYSYNLLFLSTCHYNWSSFLINNTYITKTFHQLFLKVSSRFK